MTFDKLSKPYLHTDITTLPKYFYIVAYDALLPPLGQAANQ
jgi:hypothetical protein